MRTTKGKAVASSSTAPTQKETPQVSAAQEDPERQLESDYDDAPEEASLRTLRNQVQELARNQSHTETVLQLILQRITELNDGPANQSSTRGFATTPFVRPTLERDNPMPSTESSGFTRSKKLPDPSPLSDGKDPTFLS
jgi:hypothetical protein